MTFVDYLKSLIKIKGSLTIVEFMQEALFNPLHGYYQKKIPIGKDGDFITAPEISQVFGELIGLYFLNLASGSKKPIALVEMGAGKGSLLRNFLLMIKKLAEKNIIEAQNFLEKTSIHIVEISPVLQKIQKESLAEIGIKINWHDNFQGFLENVKKDEEIYFVANELFDCFPINQFIKTQEGWCEKVISLKDEELEFFIEGFNPLKNKIVEQLIKESLVCEQGLWTPQQVWGNKLEIAPPVCHPAIVAGSISPDNKLGFVGNGVEENAVFEHSFSAANFMQELAQALHNQGGVALIIDYGYSKNEFKNSLQALKNHQFHDCLKNIGDADITALVNFSLLEKIAKKLALNSSLVSQKEFLEGLGIEERRKILLAEKNDEQKSDINSRINRLIEPGQMGELFKCLIIWK
jgi:SAM-dependent MidA family methyltransferase